MANNKTLIIHPSVKIHKNINNITYNRSNENKLQEAIGLAQAIFLEVVLAEIVYISKIIPGTLIGTGKLEEFKEYINAHEIELVIIDENITPIQQRNLEKFLQCKVIDRTALILEIFGERAQTKEGKLQVDLAALEYQKSRLVRSWTHLERQRGGSGFMGGPGEKQIESDKRMINERIGNIKKQLKKVVNTRDLHRKSRQKIPYKIVSLVGYTNAGKSTLFNLLTKAGVYAKDQLFATLDPTMRLIKLPSGEKIIISDTVGFISNLPTQLVAAFKATLEEVVHADLLLHVRDISHEDTKQQKQDVDEILEMMGLDEHHENYTIEVLNKIDLLEKEKLKNLKDKTDDNCCLVSATKDKNIKNLLKMIDKKLSYGDKIIDIEVKNEDGQMLAWIYEHAKIIKRKDLKTKIKLQISINEKNLGKLNKLVGSDET